MFEISTQGFFIMIYDRCIQQNDPGCIATSAQPASYLGSQSYISGQLDHAHFNVTADNNSWLIPGPNSLDNNSR